ncbi:MAG: methylmalonyl-CoA mutase subunit beta [Marinirhabdus sp.]
MSQQLFSEFGTVTAKQWKQDIQANLYGADYNSTLVWQGLEGINVKPFYHPDHFSKPFPPVPGHPVSWGIAQHIFMDEENTAKQLTIKAVKGGAETIIFTAEKNFDFKALFDNFDFLKVEIQFHFNFFDKQFFEQLFQFLEEKKATVHYNLDPIGHLAATGNWFKNQTEDFALLDRFTQNPRSKNILGVGAATYQNAGANCVQQLAYAVGHAHEYIARAVNAKNSTVAFNVAVGSNYFFEIAKIRALRSLYALIATQYGLGPHCHITTTPTKRNKTLYGYNVNMLRTTTECMSAILGGANTVGNLPYDVLYHKSNDFGERISRNQLLILKNESYFNTVSNPADGAYYIESLTSQMAEKALKLFKEMEASGGFLNQLFEGTVQKKIAGAAQKEQQLFNDGTLKLVGKNSHPNKNDTIKNELQLQPFKKTQPRTTRIPPITPIRLAENHEQNRLKNET